MKENPYEASKETEGRSSLREEKSISVSKAAYNTVTDTIGGLNIRKSDNLFQLKFISASVLIFGLIGGVAVWFSGDAEFPWYAGALMGAFAGLILGFLASGIFLMIFRAVRHFQGKHD